jgi:hypothetical protein
MNRHRFDLRQAIADAQMTKPTRPKVFVSYHHGGDQTYYDEFSRFFHDRYETVRDNSLERIIQSDNTEYVMRKIREEFIAGTSCTVVLIGAQSHERKYIDWEIKATLDKNHGLVGIVLPTHRQNEFGQIVVPHRLHDNVQSGYAVLTEWTSLTVQALTQAINSATSKSSLLIRNLHPMRVRNG